MRNAIKSSTYNFFSMTENLLKMDSFVEFPQVGINENVYFDDLYIVVWHNLDKDGTCFVEKHVLKYYVDRILRSVVLK